MKLYINLGLITAFGLFAATYRSGKASPPQNTRREVVVLVAKQTYERVDMNSYKVPDLVVETCSRSAGSPEFPTVVWGSTNAPTIAAAEALAQLISQGYRLEKTQENQGQFTYLLIK